MSDQAQARTMKAIVYRRYGSPDILALTDVPKPVVKDGDVLVCVRAASVNPLDWHLLRGLPYIARQSGGWRKPKRNIPGVDVAGVVEAVGRDVTGLQPGEQEGLPAYVPDGEPAIFDGRIRLRLPPGRPRL